MKKIILTVFISLPLLLFAQKEKALSFENRDLIQLQEKVLQDSAEIEILKESIKQLKLDNQISEYANDSIIDQYSITNDRLNNYLTFTGIIASIFGVLIAIAGIIIGFQSLRSQKRSKEAVKTLEEAKDYVNNKKSEFDTLIETKKNTLITEYDKILKLLKIKLLEDIEMETSKVKEIVESKSDEIQGFSIENRESKTIGLLQKRLKFFENVGIPDDPDILFSKSKILKEKDMHPEAIQLLEKIIEIDSNHDGAYWYLGYEYGQINEIEASIKNYEKCLELKPKNTSALNNVAMKYFTKKKYLDALEKIDKAISLSEKEELYLRNRIKILEALNSMTRMIEDWEKLIELNPSNKHYLISLTNLLKQEKKYEKAIFYYDKGINHFEDDESDFSDKLSIYKALYLKENEKLEEAVEIFQGLIDKNYQTERCYIFIADLKDQMGKPEEGLEILNNGISNNPRSSALYWYKAHMQIDESEAKALETLREGGDLINNESYFMMGGRFFHSKGNRQFSVFCYENAVKIIEEKLSEEDLNEGDSLNLYESLLILEETTEKFDTKYRQHIQSEKYRFILSILDIFKSLFENFDSEVSEKQLNKIKELNIEEKDQDVIKWSFNDLIEYSKNQKSSELISFVRKLVEYIQGKIAFESLK